MHLIPTIEEPEFLSDDIQSHLNAGVMISFMRMSDDQIREEMLTREQNRMQANINFEFLRRPSIRISPLVSINGFNAAILVFLLIVC